MSDFPYTCKHNFVPPNEYIRRLKNNTYIIESECGTKVTSTSDVYEQVNKVTNLFTEYARVRANVSKYASPLKYWTEHRAHIREQAKKKFGCISPYALRETVYLNAKEATLFSVALAKYVYDNFLECNGNVLDPFSGWGDRAIGAIASDKVLSYTGVDCNTLLKNGYAKLKKELDHTNKINFNITQFESFSCTTKYDLIFTSPPFYEYEVYSDSEAQSSYNKSYEEWLEWYHEVLLKMCDMCTPKGHIILYVGNTYSAPRLVEETIEYMSKNVKFIKRINSCCELHNGSVPLLVFQR